MWEEVTTFSRESTNTTPSGRVSGFAQGSKTRTRAPIAARMRATREPTAPYPTTPAVEPEISMPTRS